MPTTPHRCPLCDGEGRRLRLWADATGPLAVRCDACGGTGIVWEPERPTVDPSRPHVHPDIPRPLIS